MKQVQDTGLYKHVAAFSSSAASPCRNLITSGDGKNLQNIAASVCCQGAQIFAGKSGISERYCCRETCVKRLKANGHYPITVVRGIVVNGSTEQGVDMLVPSSQTNHPSCCCTDPRNHMVMHPAGNDVLTALLLALPAETWSGIKDEKLLQEVYDLVSIENLPVLLQEEVSCFIFV